MSRFHPSQPTATGHDLVSAHALVQEPRRATTLIHIGARATGAGGDADLATFLLSAWRRLHTASRRPPRCPRCGERAAFHSTDEGGLPQFQCTGCRQPFTRLTGTPVGRLRLGDKAEAFFGLASRQITVAEAARRLLIKSETVRHWSLQTRLWLLSLDPKGDWERRMLLGVRYAVLPEGGQVKTLAATRECRCAVASDDSDALAEIENPPLLVRVCPVCELKAH
ncbi:DUF746 domain-containing protein [Cupriavidus sp. 2TAF22]|uniref:DUF746 domain-containing protein n=1 Tax=unclassified Cupriavidus TaxID=2640874 RepID=UPI003F935168